VWRINNFYRDVWRPARRASGLECTPQDFRHSYVSNLSAADIDVADLADISGHSVETAQLRSRRLMSPISAPRSLAAREREGERDRPRRRFCADEKPGCGDRRRYDHELPGGPQPSPQAPRFSALSSISFHRVT
jgi:hypothetical protein